MIDFIFNLPFYTVISAVNLKKTYTIETFSATSCESRDVSVESLLLAAKAQAEHTLTQVRSKRSESTSLGLTGPKARLNITVCAKQRTTSRT